MSDVMLALGGYRFSMTTAAYQRLRRSDVWRWIFQDRIGRKPSAQFTGPGKSEVEIEGVIYPHYKGGLGQIPAMRAEADKGEPLLLADGYGNVWGQWVIERLDATETVPLANGAPRKIEFRLNLSTYGEDT
jgi:hypothetical protein